MLYMGILVVRSGKFVSPRFALADRFELIRDSELSILNS